MNYPANTRVWKIGDQVIHDADAKKPEMLMVVVGYTGDGLVKSHYLGEKKLYINESRFLHDPQRFGIAVATTEAA